MITIPSIGHWGSDGFASCPQLCTCRFDCGWAKETFHEVHALTLERNNRPSHRAADDIGISRERVFTDLGPHGLAEIGERGMDIVTEQYQKTKNMLLVRRDGRVVQTVNEKELERMRNTAGGVQVGDGLRKEGSSTRPPMDQRITKTSDLRLEAENIERKSKAEPTMPKASSDTHESRAGSMSGKPLLHH